MPNYVSRQILYVLDSYSNNGPDRQTDRQTDRQKNSDKDLPVYKCECICSAEPEREFEEFLRKENNYVSIEVIKGSWEIIRNY